MLNLCSRREEVCVNPYHYMKIQAPLLPSVVVPVHLRNQEVGFRTQIIHFL